MLEQKYGYRRSMPQSDEQNDIANVLREMTEAQIAWHDEVTVHLRKAENITQQAIAIKQRLYRRLEKANTGRVPADRRMGRGGLLAAPSVPGSTSMAADVAERGAQVYFQSVIVVTCSYSQLIPNRLTG